MKHENGRRGQLKQEVNLLRDTPLGKYVSHGYPVIRSGFEKLKSSFDWDDVNKFYVGVHENCQVTTTRSGSSFIDAPPGMIVHQVYAAAFNFVVMSINVRIHLKLLGKCSRLSTRQQ
jgi:hypothetical protein